MSYIYVDKAFLEFTRPGNGHHPVLTKNMLMLMHDLNKLPPELIPGITFLWSDFDTVSLWLEFTKDIKMTFHFDKGSSQYHVTKNTITDMQVTGLLHSDPNIREAIWKAFISYHSIQIQR